MVGGRIGPPGHSRARTHCPNGKPAALLHVQPEEATIAPTLLLQYGVAGAVAGMLERIELTDFKAFHRLELGLERLTFLLGPNNAGKSSIIAPLRLLAQTATSADLRVPLLLDGPLGDFGTYRDLVFGNYRGRPFRVTLSGVAESARRSHRMSDEEDSGGHWRLDLEFKYRTRRRQLILREAELSDGRGHLVTATYVRGSDRHVITKLTGRLIEPHLRAASNEYLTLEHFIPHVYFPYSRAVKEPETILGGQFTAKALRTASMRAREAAWNARDALIATEYLSAMRVAPERTYHQTGEARSRIGAAGENWAGILVLDSARVGEASRDIRDGVSRWLAEAGLASEISLNWLSDRHYEVQIRHPITKEIENLADVGQANSQVLPVLVGGLRLAAGSTYMVEEPEIHLHPRAQAALGDFFVDLLRRGVSSVVETHSEYLILRIQQCVAAGDLDPDDVAFLYVSADAATGTKTVRRLTLDSSARFREPLDGGFFPQRLDEARRLAQLRAE